MAAHAIPIAHPGPEAAAARQYPFGMPLPGQGPPAAAPAHRQAAGPQGASRHTKLVSTVFPASVGYCCQGVCLVVQVAVVVMSVIGTFRMLRHCGKLSCLTMSRFVQVIAGVVPHSKHNLIGVCCCV